MTDQLEQDLTALFARRAEETEAPPIPARLLGGAAGHPRPHRRTIAIGLVAAAAVAAVAVPVGIALRGDDDRPAPAPQPDGTQGLELPYLLDGALHVDGRTLPTTGDTIVVAGDLVLVGSSDEEGLDLTWERLAGDELVAAPYLDGVYGVTLSYDGTLAAAPVDDRGATAVRVWDVGSGEVVDTIALDEPPAPEDPWLWGFDGAGRLYWQDGSDQEVRTTDGRVAAVDTAGRGFAGIAPAGILVRDGNSPDVEVLAVGDDGSTRRMGTVPVSANAAWRDEQTVVSVPTVDNVLSLTDLAAGTTSEVPWTPRPYTLVGWSGEDIVVVVDGGADVNRVLTIDPGTGAEETVLEYGYEEPYPFASTGGTGAL